jgi:hypothetical protein
LEAGQNAEEDAPICAMLREVPGRTFGIGSAIQFGVDDQVGAPKASFSWLHIEMRCWWNQSLLRYLLGGLPVRAQGLALSGEPALDATCN